MPERKCRKENAFFFLALLMQPMKEEKFFFPVNKACQNFCQPVSKEVVVEDKCMDQHERIAIVPAVSKLRIPHIL